MTKLEQIKQQLSKAIKQSGLTQTEIANRLGVSQQTVSYYVKGDKMPALDTFANLCAVLNEDANDILCIGEYKKD